MVRITAIKGRLVGFREDFSEKGTQSRVLNDEQKLTQTKEAKGKAYKNPQRLTRARHTQGTKRAWRAGD